jgi:hypothetical protein
MSGKRRAGPQVAKGAFMSLHDILEKYDRLIEVEIQGATEADLNDLKDGGIKAYDPSLEFRKEVISKGYRILTLIARHFQGWELDEWGAIAEKDGERFKVTTYHGRFVTTVIEG